MVRHENAGFSLIEILISISIGLLILSLLLEIYVTAQRSIGMQNALHTIQDNATTAIQLLKREIHQAGHIGCAKLTADFPIHSHVSYTFNASNKITGNTNQLTVRYARYPHAVLLETMPNFETLVTDTTVTFDKGDIVIISNCQQAEIFTIKKREMVRGKQHLHADQTLNHLYEPFSEVSLLAVNRYFIDKTTRNHADHTPVYALYVQDIHHIKTEVVPDIAQLKITWKRHQSQLVGIGMDIDLNTPPLKKTWYLWSRTG